MPAPPQTLTRSWPRALPLTPGACEPRRGHPRGLLRACLSLWPTETPWRTRRSAAEPAGPAPTHRTRIDSRRASLSGPRKRGSPPWSARRTPGTSPCAPLRQGRKSTGRAPSCTALPSSPRRSPRPTRGRRAQGRLIGLAARLRAMWVPKTISTPAGGRPGPNPARAGVFPERHQVCPIPKAWRRGHPRRRAFGRSAFFMESVPATLAHFARGRKRPSAPWIPQ